MYNITPLENELRDCHDSVNLISEYEKYLEKGCSFSTFKFLENYRFNYYYIGIDSFYCYSNVPIRILGKNINRIRMIIFAFRVKELEKNLTVKRCLSSRDGKSYHQDKTVSMAYIVFFVLYNYTNCLIRAPPRGLRGSKNIIIICYVVDRTTFNHK